MKKFFVFFCFLLLGLSAAAQGEESRESYLYARRDTCDLYLDVFRPVAGSDTTFHGQPKPTVIFIFGGGFIMGERVDEITQQWFNRLNENGYTLVTIDYRLGMKGKKIGKGLLGAYKASDLFCQAQQVGVEDLFSAIKFISDNSEELGIDPGNLVVSGSSAGAIISQKAEYDILCGRTGELPDGFQFKGVMSFAGAVISGDGPPKYPSAPCPMLLLHGTSDKTVAYNKYAAFGRGIWGSDFLVKHWTKQGYNNYCIYRFKDRQHEVAAYMNYVWDLEKDFLEQNVILGRERTIDTVIDDPSLPVWPWARASLDNMYGK